MKNECNSPIVWTFFGTEFLWDCNENWHFPILWPLLSFSNVRCFVTPAACLASLSITNSRSLLKLMSVESVIPSNYLIVCHPLPLLPSVFPSIRVFSSESVLHIKWPKYWSFNFTISPSNEYSGLIFFRIDWFDLLAVQGTLETLLQKQLESINSSVLSLLYGPTLPFIHDYWKNHSFDNLHLCRQSGLCFLIHCLGLS